MASKKKTISTPRRTSVRKSKQPSMQTLLFVVVGLFAILFGVWAVSSRGRSFNLRSGAWDCSKYNFTVRQNGEVFVENLSAYNEPSTGVEVGIDGQLVATLTAPALQSGQSAVIGTVPVPANGIFSWGARALADQRCVDTGSYTQACNVAYISSKRVISEANGSGGYLPRNFVTSTLNGVANVTSYDLYTESLPQGALDYTDIVIMSDWSTQQPGYNPGGSELLTSAEIQTIKNAYQAGMSVVVVGDNGKPYDSTTTVDAAATIIPLVNTLQSSYVYYPAAVTVQQVQTTATQPAWGNPVPMLTGSTINTTTSAYASPGWIKPSSGQPGTCMYLSTYYGPNQTCILAYMPPTSGKGFLVIDGNAGFPMKTTNILKNVVEEACAISNR